MTDVKREASVAEQLEQIQDIATAKQEAKNSAMRAVRERIHQEIGRFFK